MTRELLTKVACCEFDVQVQLKKDFSTDVCGELEIIEDCRTVHLDSNMHGLSAWKSALHQLDTVFTRLKNC